jgi:hypothetical protein
MTAFNVTQSGNTITISNGIAGLKNVNMPGIGSGVPNNVQWKEDIFFQFWDKFGGMTYFYSQKDLSTYTFTAHDIGMMLAMLFPNFYNNANANTIQTDYPEFGPLFARLNGADITISPSYAFSTTFDDTVYTPSGGGAANKDNAKGYVFQHYGLCGTTNSNMSSFANASLTGVHLTSNDPAFPAERLNGYYDATNSGLTQAIVIYTNLFTTAFSNNGMIHPFQFLAIWPLLARISKTDDPTRNPIAFMGTSMDTLWMKRGSSNFFNRGARKNTTYGCFGNYLLSIFNYNPLGLTNSWDIPIVPVFANLFEYANAKIKMNAYFNSFPASPKANDQAIAALWDSGYLSGPPKNFSGNIKPDNEKVFRRLMMLYCAALERDNTFGENFITNTENQIKALYPIYAADISLFYQSGASLLSNGEYAYMWKYASTVAYTPSGGALTNVFAYFIAPYIPSWSANVLALPNVLALSSNYIDGQNALFSGSTILNTAISTVVGGLAIGAGTNISDMDATQMNNITNYSYTP